MQLNVLDDLAEAMKALDGKKAAAAALQLLRWPHKFLQCCACRASTYGILKCCARHANKMESE